MNVGYPNPEISGRETDMPIVVYNPRKGKSADSEGALLKIKFSKATKDRIDGQTSR